MKNVYFFGSGKAEGCGQQKNLLGGKGANLAEMTTLGIPVPPGFTITTDVCTYFMYNNKLPENIPADVNSSINKIEKIMKKKFGCPTNPLLVSVRSGAKESMPGMMETVLNVGLTSKTVVGLAEITTNPRFAYDSYRRLIMMYADVVMEKSNNIQVADNCGIRHQLEEYMEEYKIRLGYKEDIELQADDLISICNQFKKIIKKQLKMEFPDDAKEQLNDAIKAVFKSWNGERAKNYRKIEGISDDAGTAVNIQSMVFGNMGSGSATGVAFTRNPSTGENIFYGEWLENAQGEDVVAGIRTPNPLNNASRSHQSQHLNSLEDTYPKIYKELYNIKNNLERHYKDMQDIEFTIQNKKLWMLQTRNGKRNGTAAINIAFDLEKNNLINTREVLNRITSTHLNEIMLPALNINDEKKSSVIAKGLPAGPGGATGQIVFTADDAQLWHKNGKNVILVRQETSPEDIHGMYAAVGILTSRGGMTSHAALVARGWGKCCVVGCADININYSNKTMVIKDKIYHEGDWISLNGSHGNVYGEKLSLSKSNLDKNPSFEKTMALADQFKTVEIRANADTKIDAENSLNLGARGIGLCRTEHMFFNPERIKSMRKMILADTPDARKLALKELLPYQKKDFYDILKSMSPYPVTIRLLDPPLHEFLPQTEEQIHELARELDINVKVIQKTIESLHETNPMLGHRGCRLGVSYPEITIMQSQAIFDACSQLIDEGVSPYPEIMVPLIGTAKEFINQKNIILSVYETMNVNINYKIGTMIELPRACLIADQIAEHADFFSFGTNDLTQTTFGYSRDDVGAFIHDYLKDALLPGDPFESIDIEGVGKLVKIAVDRGRSINKNLKIGICGEHGGDPQSIKFFEDIGLDYVSCSPFRVPIARLSSAHCSK